MKVSFDPVATEVARKIIERQLMSDLPTPIDPSSSVTMALVVGNEVVGGVVWHNWHPVWQTIEITCATMEPMPWTRGVMQAMAEIPFIQWGCMTIVMRTSEDNERVHRLLPRVGFERHEVPYIRAGKPDVVYVLTREAWAERGLASDKFKALLQHEKLGYKEINARRSFPPEGSDTANAAGMNGSA